MYGEVRQIDNRNQMRFLLRCVLMVAASQMLAFYATRLLPAAPMHVLTSRLDEAIPVVPVWVTVYFLVFLDWAAAILAILSDSRAHARRFTGAYMIAMLLSGLLFVFYPCTMARPELPGHDVFSALLRLLYRIDPPTYLFPSLHVLVTYLCWRGAMGCRRLPKWFARLQLGALVCVCLCILFVKQHVLLDIPAALLVGESAMQLSKLLPLGAEADEEEREGCCL